MKTGLERDDGCQHIWLVLDDVSDTAPALPLLGCLRCGQLIVDDGSRRWDQRSSHEREAEPVAA